MTESHQDRTALVYAAALALMPLLAAIAPRALAGFPALAGLAGFLAVAWQRRSFAGILNRPALLIAGLITGFSLCSILWSVAPGETFERSWKTAPILAGLVFMISTAVILPAQALRKGLRWLPHAVFGAAFLLTVDFVAGYPLFRMLNGFAQNASVNASLLNRGIVFLCLCVFPAMAVAQKKSLAFLIPCIAAVPVALSDSQSAQVGLLAGLACLALFPRGKNWAWRAAAAAVVVYTMLMPWIALMAFSYAGTIDGSHYFGEGGAYGAQRLEIWHFIADSIIRHPMLGHGVEAARGMHFLTQQRFFDSDTVLHPHNVVLQIWLEGGAAGIACVTVLLLWLLQKIREMPDEARRFILPLYVTTLCIASTAYGIWQGWWVGLLTLLAAYAVLAGKIPFLKE